MQDNSHRLYVLLSPELGSISILNQVYDHVSEVVICIPAWADLNELQWGQVNWPSACRLQACLSCELVVQT